MATRRQSSEKTRQSRGRQEQGRSQMTGSSDLKSREYRDANGNIHHHTRKYMEQHRGKKQEEGQ